MCKIDTGDSVAEVWQERIIASARREHRCDMCGGSISRGSSYLRHFSVFDGSANNEAQCLPCVTIRDAFRREHRNFYSPSGMRDLLVECLDDSSYDDDDERQPLTDAAMRWKYALAEMKTRADARKE